MARIESVSVAGYFPTPLHLLPQICGLFQPVADENAELSILDPCAGEGVAVFTLAKLCKEAEVYACEMEAGRFEEMEKNAKALSWAYTRNLVRGDAFRTVHEGDVSLLYLNPPYDTDRVHGRLEQKFLLRFACTLREGGALLFVVPFYALEASAETIAREFEDVKCFRFPAADFEGYKQVVFYGRKRATLDHADEVTLARVLGWAADASTIPELPTVPIVPLPTTARWGARFKTWAIKSVDVTALLAKVRPWTQTMKAGGSMAVPNIIPDLPVADLLLRHYEMATPPRPAHIAAGIASGLFNGSRIESSTAGLPPLLVKGVFDREYKTIEEKRNKDGEVKALVQIQQPKLVTTILDLSTHRYHTLKSVTTETKGDDLDVAEFSVADLLKHYGKSLMGVMEAQCPILYDPRRDGDTIKLGPSPRKLFVAQAHASKAIVKLLGGNGLTRRQRRGKAAVLLGEIGSGKSTVSIMAARAISSKRILILCPPHLLKGWTNEITAIAPDAEVRVLESLTDIEELTTMPAERTVVAILSRETAKLTHGWEGCGLVCPACGDTTPKVDLAKKRARCEARQLRATDDFARAAVALAHKLSRFAPKDGTVANLLRGRFDKERLEWFSEKKIPEAPLPVGSLDGVLAKLLVMHKDGSADKHKVEQAIMSVLLATGDDERILTAAKRLQENESEYTYQSFASHVLMLLSPDCEAQNAFVAVAKTTVKNYNYNPWSAFPNLVARSKEGAIHLDRLQLSWHTGECIVNGTAARSLAAALKALSAVASFGKFAYSAECGEHLYQAAPSPRRVALAGYITKRHPDLFDFLILDEGHEYATDGSAQERAAHRLTALGMPTILMTGSIMNGYAESLFTNMWALSPDFREEFGRDERQTFIDRYGYRKRIVEDRDKDSGEIVEFGSMSDRVTRSEREIGNAPGVLPLFLLRHLLPMAVTLHKADLAIDLPACRQQRHEVVPDAELFDRYQKLQTRLVSQIRRDMFKPDLSGRLWGQLAEIPSYLDLATADTGNTDCGDYEISYPESVGGEVVMTQAPFPKEKILPKEAWALDMIERELAEGRNVMLFSWHVALLPRLARLVSERIGEPVAVLHAEKVPTGKRQDWIDREVVKKKRRVMVSNPVAIQTGLNNLVHFATEIWMENPACNPVIFRQAIGRVDRIGQKKETRIHYPVYQNTMQVQLYDLLMQKVAVSVSTDGLDPESALQAAGVGEDSYLAGLSIGKQLWSMLGGDAYAA